MIVSYNPTNMLKRSVLALLEQVDGIVIVDNGSCAQARMQLDEVEGDSVTVIRHPENLGVAAALNAGIRLALRSDYEWIATFDQDSTPTPNLIRTMLDAYSSCPDRELVGLIAPVHVMSEQDCHYLSSGSLFCELKTTMTSGNLLNRNLFEDIGFFNEAFFIDYVDHEFCLRLRRRGYKVIQACRALLPHRLGNTKDHVVLGRTYRSTHHNAVRRYYRARNRVAVYREYVFDDPLWVFSDLYLFGSQLLRVLFLEEDKFGKVSGTFLGMWHGLCGKMGKLEFPARW